MSNYTPGPWWFCENGEGMYAVGAGDKELTHAVLGRYNARLIAAAPDLLHALKLALASHGVMLLSDPPQDAWKVHQVEAIAKTAIAKAIGEA